MTRWTPSKRDRRALMSEMLTLALRRARPELAGDCIDNGTDEIADTGLLPNRPLDRDLPSTCPSREGDGTDDEEEEDGPLVSTPLGPSSSSPAPALGEEESAPSRSSQ